jgi:type I restriction enzyme S subunit
VRLGDVVTLQRGFDLPEGERRSGSVPIVSSSGVTGSHDEARVGPPAVVTGRYGTLGDVYFVNQPCWPLNTTLFVKDFHGNDPRFCYYFLQAQQLGRHEGAAAVPGVNRNVLHELPVRVPPLTTEHKIAAILSAYDDLIENDTRRIKILEEMAERIYREWFFEFRYPGHGAKRQVRSGSGLIPRGWRSAPVSEELSIDPKRAIPKGQQVRFVPMAGLSETTMHIATTELRVDPGGSRFMNDDTLFARITPCLENGKTAFVQILEPGEVGAGSTEFIVLRGRSLTPEYVYLLARSDPFREHAIKSMSGATGRQRVRRGAFDTFYVVVPPDNVLARFSQLVRPLFQESYILFRAQSVLRAARDLLLPRLISGQIDVDTLDIPVPDAVA